MWGGILTMTFCIANWAATVRSEAYLIDPVSCSGERLETLKDIAGTNKG